MAGAAQAFIVVRLMNPSGPPGKLLSGIRSYLSSKLKTFFSGRLSALEVLFPNL